MKKKNSFDRETVKSIAKGGAIAFTGAGSIALLNYIGTINIDNPTLASLVAMLVPFAVNVIKEYIQGNE